MIAQIIGGCLVFGGVVTILVSASKVSKDYQIRPALASGVGLVLVLLGLSILFSPA